MEARTVARVRERYAVYGVDAVLPRGLRYDQGPQLLDGAAETRLVALACATPPDEADPSSRRLLASEAVRPAIVPVISYETVRTAFKKTIANRG